MATKFPPPCPNCGVVPDVYKGVWYPCECTPEEQKAAEEEIEYQEAGLSVAERNRGLK